MTCPACGAGPVSVLKSLDSGAFIQRRRACRCGARWTTNEGLIRGSLTIIEGTLVAAGGQETGPPGQQTKDPGQQNPNPGKGAISSDLDPSLSPDISDPDPDPSLGGDQRSEPPRKRGPAKAYSDAFEACWQQYGRKEEKVAAYAAWKIAAKEFGGEDNLRVLVLAALKWQAPIWARDGWKFAKYFERYLKKRRWQDERPGGRPALARASSPPVPISDVIARAAQLEEQAAAKRQDDQERFQRDKAAAEAKATG